MLIQRLSREEKPLGIKALLMRYKGNWLMRCQNYGHRAKNDNKLPFSPLLFLLESITAWRALKMVKAIS